MALSHSDRERLARLLAMFSSDFDGEIVNAARAAERLIKRSGETWESVIVSAATPIMAKRDYTYDYTPPRPNRQSREEYPSHREEVAACQEKADLLSAWEREFLDSILERWSLSDKQRARLDQIIAKLKKFEGMDW